MNWSKLIFLMVISSIIFIPTTSAAPAVYKVVCNATISKGINGFNQAYINITVKQCFGYFFLDSSCGVSKLEDRIPPNSTYTYSGDSHNISSIQEGDYIIKGTFWGGFLNLQEITDNRSLDAIAQEDCRNYVFNSFINSGEIYFFSPLILCVAFAFIKKPSKKIKFLGIDWRKLSLFFLLMFTFFMGFEFLSFVPAIIPFPINYLTTPFMIIGLILLMPIFIVMSSFKMPIFIVTSSFNSESVLLQYIAYFIMFLVYPLFLSLGIFYLYDNGIKEKNIKKEVWLALFLIMLLIIIFASFYLGIL
jgi:hypothetical protein